MDIILNTFGTQLYSRNGLFVVQHPEGKQSIDPRKIRTISISRGAKISSDAALLAIENEVEVLFIDQVGTPRGRLWSVKYGSVSTIRRKQLEFIYTPQSISWIKDVIIRKIDNQTAHLLSLDNAELKPAVANAVNKFEDYKNKIRALKATVISEIAPSLRGWEGAASRIYFGLLAKHLPEQYRFEKRSQHPATDIFNALLNYGYGMLYGKVEGALIKAGIDPYAGVFHRDDYNRPVLVFDVIEIFRVWIDFVVVNLCLQEVIDNDMFSEKDGGVWLEGMGKRILIQSVNDYFEEIINIDRKERSRNVHIEIYAQKLAKIFTNTPDR